MKCDELLERIEKQTGIKLIPERQSSKWIYITLPRHNITVLSYLAKIGVRYEQHMKDSYYLILK